MNWETKKSIINLALKFTGRTGFGASSPKAENRAVFSVMIPRKHNTRLLIVITNSYLYIIKCKHSPFCDCALVKMDSITHFCLIMYSSYRLSTQSSEFAVAPYHIVKSLRLQKNSSIPTWMIISYIYYLMCTVYSKNVYKFV